MVVGQIDAVNELQEALHLLVRRWTLAIPTAIASLISAVLIVFLIGSVIASVIGAALVGQHGAAFAILGAGALSVAAALLTIAVIGWIAYVMVIAAAEDAWEGREPNFASALRLAIVRSPALVVAFIAIALICVIPIALSFVFIGIPLLIVIGFFLMYVTPAIMLGAEDGIGAIGTSIRLVRIAPGPSVVAFLGILAAFVAGRAVDAMFLHIPFVGLLAAFVVGGFTTAYAALVAVRFYDLLARGNVRP